MKDYKEILEGVVNIINTTKKSDIGFANICAYIGENCPELKDSEDERTRKRIYNYINVTLDDNESEEKEKWLAWLEEQGEKELDPRYIILDKLIEADDIYQMSVNDAMVEEAKNKAIEALSKLEISKLLGLEKQGEQDMIRLDKAIKFLDEQLVNDKDEVTGEPFINFQNYGTFKETFISFFKRKMLEKQSEKPQGKLALEATKEEKVDNQNCVKPVDEVEPKFKVGNWYQCTKDFFGKGVTFDKNTAYYCAKEGCLQNEYGCHIAIVKDLYDNFKLWTIQDAKDGDVLSNGKMIVIFKHFEEPSYRQHIVAYIGLDTNGDIQITDDTWNLGIDKAKPATKEQCDLLFQKMKEEGYVWLSGKKRLVKLLFKEGDTVRKKLDGSIWHINYINEHGYWGNHKPLFPIENQNEFELVKQKPWSEEDRKNYQMLQKIIRDSDITANLANKLSDWLKDLKDRVQPQTTWKPSEEHIHGLIWVINRMPDLKKANEAEAVFRDLLEQLNKLRKE